MSFTLTRNRAPEVRAPGPGIAARAVDATKVYGRGEAEVRALDGVTVDFATGRFTAIMGPSGSGKSTLMHAIAGLDTLTDGTVWIGDTELGSLSEKKLTQLRRDRIGFVFQSFNLIPTLTAAENIALPMRLAGLDRPTAGSVYVGTQDITRMSDKALTKLRRQHIGFVFQSFNLLPTLSAQENVLLPLAIAGRKPERDVVDELMEKMGLAERRDHKPAQLSGGQQQRVAVARALICRPTVLFADEPTGNLDSAAGAGVLDLLRTAVDEDGQTTVMVTHDARAAATADRVLFLADGRVVADLQGPTEETILSAMKDAARA